MSGQVSAICSVSGVIDIEQHALGAFEQDAPPACLGLVQRQPNRAGELKHEVGDFAQLSGQRGPVHRRLAEAGAERIVMGGEAVDLRTEAVEMGKVADANGAAADLVLVSWADAPASGADLACAARILA